MVAGYKVLYSRPNGDLSYYPEASFSEVPLLMATRADAAELASLLLRSTDCYTVRIVEVEADDPPPETVVVFRKISDE